jgi:asparaginyl-tRNA synthetase
LNSEINTLLNEHEDGGKSEHVGFGLGFERLVQFCTGMHNIRDVIPFPRAPRLCV